MMIGVGRAGVIWPQQEQIHALPPLPANYDFVKLLLFFLDSTKDGSFSLASAACANVDSDSILILASALLLSIACVALRGRQATGNIIVFAFPMNHKITDS